MINFLKKLGQFFLDTIQAIVLALSLFIVVYLFLFQPHLVKGSSMYPSFHNGEFLLTNKITYRLGPPQRGDVIVFKAPSSEPCAEIDCEYIKRIIALPNERVKVSGGRIYINEQPLNESDYLSQEVTTTSGSFLIENVERVIPEDYFLALGDNRPYSRDGREFGPISSSSIVGKAWLRYWPINEIGFVKHENYP